MHFLFEGFAGATNSVVDYLIDDLVGPTNSVSRLPRCQNQARISVFCDYLAIQVLLALSVSATILGRLLEIGHNSPAETW